MITATGKATLALAEFLARIVIYRDGLMRLARYLLWANGISQGQEEGRRALASRPRSSPAILRYMYSSNRKIRRSIRCSRYPTVSPVSKCSRYHEAPVTPRIPIIFPNIFQFHGSNFVFDVVKAKIFAPTQPTARNLSARLQYRQPSLASALCATSS